MGFIKKIFRKDNLLFVIVAILFVIVSIQLTGIMTSMSSLKDTNSSLITEIGEIKSANIAFGNDMNEMRQRLLLPQKEYFSFDDPSSNGNDADSSSKSDELHLAVVDYLSFVGAKESLGVNNQKYSELLTSIYNNEELTALLTEKNLSKSELSDDENAMYFEINDNEGNELIKFYLDKSNSELFQKTIIEKIEISDFNSENLLEDIKVLINQDLNNLLEKTNEIKQARESFMLAFESEDVKSYINENVLTIKEAYEKDLKLYIDILSNEELIATISLDLNTGLILLKDMKTPEQNVETKDLDVALLAFLKNLNKNTSLEIKVMETKEKIEKYLADSGLNAMLDEQNLRISKEAEEDENRYYYKIYNKATDEHISSIVIEKKTAVVNTVDADGNNAENLLLFDSSSEEEKKNLEIPDEIPEFVGVSHEEGTFNILIAGKHGNLVDTMIFAHIDENTREVRMISIPRDLFYNGRKINSFAYFYGMDELKRVLSELSGYQLDKYILIDMYAFIDVIDLIGGIDVHLNKAVIDPTYVTEDNGVWGTLHYEPGDYHFSGKQALRIARSRHTSSDFARAERQQIIIESLQNKARNMGFGDADTFYEIVKTVLAKTETDISFDEALAYYFRYQDFNVVSNNVISSGNILTVPPYITTEQCAAQIADAEAKGLARPGCESMNHAYTLVPRDNNWNIIKWYFKEKFESED